MQGKRNYKDSLFRNIFKDKKRLCSLYNALSGEKISPRDIKINTLRGTFFNDIKNDISFDIGNHTVVLMEHQGSWNPNMPLRMLWYIGKLYRRHIDVDMAYRSKMVKIPAPKFYVLYNGSKDEPEHRIMRLSEAFEGESHSLELLADSYNINLAKGKKLLDSCYELRCYSVFVAKVQEYLAAKQELSQAIKSAIRYCRDNELMKEYFKEHEKEVLDMVTFKWDDKRAREIAEEEGRADGLAKGMAEGMEKGMAKGLAEGRVEGRVEGMLRTLCSLVKDGILSNMDAAKRAGMSLEEFTKAIAML